MYGSTIQWIFLVILLILIFFVGYIFGLMDKKRQKDNVDILVRIGVLINLFIFIGAIAAAIFF
jgi:hypothetical protein